MANHFVLLFCVLITPYSEETRLGVIEEMLEKYEAVDNYIRDFGSQPKTSFKSKEIFNLLKSSAGYFAYPAGVLIVNIASGGKEFIISHLHWA